MEYIKNVIRRIRQGGLKEVWRETKSIYRYAKKYWTKIILFIILGLAGTALGIYTGLVSKELINMVMAGYGNGRRLRDILPVGSLLVGLAVGQIVLRAFSSRISAKVNLAVNREIRADIYRRFLLTNWESISRYHSGDLLNRINSDAGTVAGSVLGWIPTLITSLVQFLASLAIILHYDPVMGLITLATLPVSAIIFAFLAPKMRNLSRQTAEASADLTAFYADSLQNIQSVKAFDLVDHFSENLDGLQEKHIKASLRQNLFSVGSGAFMSLAGKAGSYLCLAWGVLRLWTKELDYGTLVLFIQLAGYLSSSANSLMSLGPSTISTTVAAKRIMTILDLPKEEVTPAPVVEKLCRENRGVTLQMRDMDFSYQDNRGGPVLRDVQFQAGPGEVVAIVGPSGSGKTTMLRLLLGLLRPTQGTTEAIDDDGVRLALGPNTRGLFAYVPQEKSLFSGTVAETLRLARQDATDEELWQVLELVYMDDVVRRMPKGLDSSIGQGGSRLSEGQGQRLSIARALLRQAPVILLDEATSALDVATERRILRNIMAKCKNKTCVVTSHRPSVLSMCSRVYEIREYSARILDQQDVDTLRREF